MILCRSGTFALCVCVVPFALFNTEALLFRHQSHSQAGRDAKIGVVYVFSMCVRLCVCVGVCVICEHSREISKECNSPQPLHQTQFLQSQCQLGDLDGAGTYIYRHKCVFSDEHVEADPMRVLCSPSDVTLYTVHHTKERSKPTTNQTVA